MRDVKLKEGEIRAMKLEGTRKQLYSRHPGERVIVGNTKQLGVSDPPLFSLFIFECCNGILKILSLQGLPAVGPKTAFQIYQHRELHGCFEDLRQLETIPGLNKNFFKKFCKQNQIDGLEDCVTE